MAKVFELAKKLIKKTDDEKAIDLLKEQVEDNQMEFSNDLHAAKKAVKTAEKRCEALDADPTASAAVIIAAGRELAVAKKTVEEIEAIIAKRF